MNPDLLDDVSEVKLRLSGKEVTLDFFKRWYGFRVELRNLWLLALVGLLSLGASAGVSAMRDLPLPGYSYVYFAGSGWMLVCYLAWRWMWERKAMRASGIALGSFHVLRLEKPFMKRVVYHFNDEQGGYHGGTLRTLFCDTRDDLTVIFYDESHPEISVPASAMMFHTLKWVEVDS
jgi:hypothetical protein